MDAMGLLGHVFGLLRHHPAPGMAAEQGDGKINKAI